MRNTELSPDYTNIRTHSLPSRSSSLKGKIKLKHE